MNLDAIPFERTGQRRDWTPEDALAYRAARAGRTVDELREILDAATPEPTFVLRRPFQVVEYRESSSGMVEFVGYASITETPYTIAGGPPYGWNETVARGAFARTLSMNPDTVFLVNHEGLPLARTVSGTLDLTEDSQGLHTVARFDTNDPTVGEVLPKMRRGDLTEMSFAFRVIRQEWTDAAGNSADSWSGTERRILEVSIERGDVSVVTYGANPHTVATLRTADIGEKRGMSLDTARALAYKLSA